MCVGTSCMCVQASVSSVARCDVIELYQLVLFAQCTWLGHVKFTWPWEKTLTSCFISTTTIVESSFCFNFLVVMRFENFSATQYKTDFKVGRSHFGSSYFFPPGVRWLTVETAPWLGWSWNSLGWIMSTKNGKMEWNENFRCKPWYVKVLKRWKVSVMWKGMRG